MRVRVCVHMSSVTSHSHIVTIVFCSGNLDKWMFSLSGGNESLVLFGQFKNYWLYALVAFYKCITYIKIYQPKKGPNTPIAYIVEYKERETTTTPPKKKEEA